MRASIKCTTKDLYIEIKSTFLAGDTDDGVVTRSVAYLYDALQKRGKSSKLGCVCAHPALHALNSRPLDTCT